MMTMTIRVPRIHAWLARPMVKGALTLTASAFVVLALVWMFAETVATSHEVVSAKDAGHLVKARFISAALDGDRTEVETTTGTFLVYGAMVAMKDSALKLELRKNGEQFLCDQSIHVCKRLVR